jgi:hypothetical protein
MVLQLTLALNEPPPASRLEAEKSSVGSCKAMIFHVAYSTTYSYVTTVYFRVDEG